MAGSTSRSSSVSVVGCGWPPRVVSALAARGFWRALLARRLRAAAAQSPNR